jgi:adenylosuccinate lyase
MSLLATRYASSEMRELWTPEFKIIKEREIWITVLKAQKNIGLDVSEEIIQKYEKVKNIVNIASIELREKQTKHDVKARIEEFNALAGSQKIHVGLTSRDITENAEMLQIKAALEIVEFKTKVLLSCLSSFAQTYVDLPIVARTHNVPAQISTLGRRFASWIEDMMLSLKHLQELKKRLPAKGMKGAIGTSQDLFELFGGQYLAVDENFKAENNLESLLVAPSQIYPRSIDYEIVTSLVQLASAPSNIAINIRLMSGHGHMSEGLQEGQTGSSAMPHKVNARLSERVSGLLSVLKGNALMIQELVGNQWNEGDVSCSVVRRIALTDAFCSVDAIFDTVIRIIKRIEVFPEVITREVNEHLPFLSSSRILAELVKRGIGREDAHSAIKRHSLAAANHFRETGENNLLKLIAADNKLNLTVNELESFLDYSKAVEIATTQAMEVIARALAESNSIPNASSYRPAELN